MSSPPARSTLLDPAFLRDPYPFYDQMRVEGPVRKHVVQTLGAEVSAWVVTRYEDVRALLADPTLSKDALQLPPVIERHTLRPDATAGQNPRSMLFSDPPHHSRL